MSNLSGAWPEGLLSDKKLRQFALLGALGCLAGAVLGEIWLWATRGNPALQAVCLVIDCSGSMVYDVPPGKETGYKMEEVKKAAKRFVERQNLKFSPIGVVEFGESTDEVSKLTGDRAQLEHAINQLMGRGQTPMDAGLRAGADELTHLPAEFESAALTRNILLFTDGKPDDAQATLKEAKACRDQGIKIVAIGTGDADPDLLGEITGDPKLVFSVDAESFETGFKQAEKAIYGGSLVSSSTGTSFQRGLLQTAGWTALIALGLGLALVAGQNLYLHRAPFTAGEAAAAIIGGLAAGVLGGAVGQLPFSAAAASENVPVIGTVLAWVVEPLGRMLGWAVLGALVGRGLAFFIPNLDARRALAGGCVGGAAAALVFLITRLAGDLVGRFLGAAILGAVIGMMLAWVEAAFRSAWLEVRYGQKETATVTLGATPVKIGSDSRACQVYARGARPLACQYRFEEGRVVFVDYATEQTSVLEPGDEREIGHVTVTVRASHKAAESAVGATPGTTGKAAPPPPPQAGHKPAAPPPGALVPGATGPARSASAPPPRTAAPPPAPAVAPPPQPAQGAGHSHPPASAPGAAAPAANRTVLPPPPPPARPAARPPAPSGTPGQPKVIHPVPPPPPPHDKK